jgi:hypothetical protein
MSSEAEGRTIMGTLVSLDGYFAHDDDSIR